MTDTTTTQNAALARRMFGLEVASERRNLDRALAEVEVLAAQVRKSTTAGSPTVTDLHRLAQVAGEALRHAAAWQALGRVEFMLPGEDGKEGDRG